MQGRERGTGEAGKGGSLDGGWSVFIQRLIDRD